MQNDNENIKYNEKDNILFLSSVYQDKKQLTVKTKDSRLNKNRIAAKNEALQNAICASIDSTNKDKKISEYKYNRSEKQRQARQAKRQAK